MNIHITFSGYEHSSLINQFVMEQQNATDHLDAWRIQPVDPKPVLS